LTGKRLELAADHHQPAVDENHHPHCRGRILIIDEAAFQTDLPLMSIEGFIAQGLGA
jgi:hypothetical protein